LVEQTEYGQSNDEGEAKMTEKNEDPFERMDDEFPFDDFREEKAPVEPPERGPASRPPRRNNRNFWLAAGILAAVFALIVIILTVLALWVLPRNREARLQEAALINAHNTATARSATDLAIIQAQLSSDTPEVVATELATETVEPTTSPVVVIDTETPEASPTEERPVGAEVDDPGRTATVAALLTQAAGGTTEATVPAATSTVAGLATRMGTQVAGQQGGATPGVTPGVTVTALPQSGFAEDVGLPGLFGLAVGLVVVIFLVRRVRLSETR
jgi:hypothetical protein